MSDFSVRVVSRKGQELAIVPCKASLSVDEFKNLFYSITKKSHPNRQWLTVDGPAGKDGKPTRVPLKGKKTLQEYGVRNGSTVTFKDLGPQISWRLVFFIEYFGCLWIHPLLYMCPEFFFSGTAGPKHWMQKAALFMVLFHYLKRELESVFVHRFSNGTMPFFNVFKNSFHYWVLSGVLIAYDVYRPSYTPPAYSLNVSYALIAAFMLFQYGNYYAHCILRDLRPPGTTERNIPRGFLFEYVSCANYTCELGAWLCFVIFTQSIGAAFFWLVSAGQISVWALKKHKQYRKEFPNYPRSRKVMVPFIW